MIRLEALTLSLGRQTVVDGVTLSIASQRVTAIVGPNGAGKTSLVRAIAGLIRPQAGDVSIEGQPVHALPDRDRARLIGYMPQNGTPAWAITVREMVALGRLPHRAAFSGESAEDCDAIEAAMRDTDTLHLADRAVDTLSGGERARAKMARVLAGRPRWLIADEPLANLDPPHQMDMLHLFRKTADGGAGVVTVLHQLDAAAQADDIIMLADGKLVAAGPVQTTMTAGHLEATFGIGFTLLESGALRIPIPSR